MHVSQHLHHTYNLHNFAMHTEPRHRWVTPSHTCTICAHVTHIHSQATTGFTLLRRPSHLLESTQLSVLLSLGKESQLYCLYARRRLSVWLYLKLNVSWVVHKSLQVHVWVAKGRISFLLSLLQQPHKLPFLHGQPHTSTSSSSCCLDHDREPNLHRTVRCLSSCHMPYMYARY